MSERERSSKKFSAGTAAVSATLSVKDPQSKRRKVVKEVSKTIQLGVKGGDSLVSVNQGLTFTENYNGVRMDVSVELPCNSDKESVIATAKQAKEVGQDLMPGIMEELKLVLAEVKSPKREGHSYA